jgi:geranylgeranyl diphosphate synthase, type II
MTKINSYLEKINSRLEILLKTPEPYIEDLYGSMRYSVFAGGKRIRPLLAMASADIVELDGSICLDFACAIEMIHTYSLIHDDMPSMDDDDYRRGKPTNHKVFGEGMALLTGDALLNLAASIMAESAALYPLPVQAVRAMAYILKCSGSEGMIAGQVLDTGAKGDDLKLMHSLKTGKLITASLVYPAILAGNGEAADKLERIGTLVGLAFQIKDDILDVEGSFEDMGKMTGRDKKQEKVTYATLHGVKGAKKLLEKETEKALLLCEEIGGNDEFLKYLIRKISKRDD